MTATMKAAAPERVRTAARRVKKASKRLQAYAGLVYLRGRNAVSRGNATGSAAVVVSMTSYGARARTVSVALESIARGSVRPQRLLLWLDDPEAMAARMPALRRLERRGVEVLLTPNFGPHTKYYPYVASERTFSIPLVTADDDIIYPVNWLKVLVEANRQHPDMINGHWVCVMGINGGTITRYTGWTRRRDTEAAANNFALGVSGVIYPPALLRELKNRGPQFLDVCPGADDIWLNWVALRAGVRTRQVNGAPRHFPIIPGSQDQALGHTNVGQGRNDHWIHGLYSAADISALTTPRPADTQSKGELNAS